MTSIAKQPELQQPDAGIELHAEVDEVIAACGGDMRAAVQALVTLVHIRESELADMRSAVSNGFRRGQFLVRIPT